MCSHKTESKYGHIGSCRVVFEGSLTGVIAQMMAVFALPPSEGSRMRVSFESRYGMWPTEKKGC